MADKLDGSSEQLVPSSRPVMRKSCSEEEKKDVNSGTVGRSKTPIGGSGKRKRSCADGMDSRSSAGADCAKCVGGSTAASGGSRTGKGYGAVEITGSGRWNHAHLCSVSRQAL